jgi:hypothetical protein
MAGLYIGVGRGVPSPPPESHNSDVTIGLVGAIPNRFATPTVVVRNNGGVAAGCTVDMCWGPATTGTPLTVCRKNGQVGTPATIDVAPVNPGAASSVQHFATFKVVDNAFKLVAKIAEVSGPHNHPPGAPETCPLCGVQNL